MAKFVQHSLYAFDLCKSIRQGEREAYRQTCLHNAELAARIIESDPAVLDDIEELKEIAASVEIDEIHIFDKTGRIFTGTHPQYYDYTAENLLCRWGWSRRPVIMP